MKRTILSLSLVVGLGLVCGSSIQPTTEDVVIIQGYEAGYNVGGKYIVKGVYVYCSSSSSNAPSFEQYPSETIPLAQALADLLSARFRIKYYSESTGTYTLTRVR